MNAAKHITRVPAVGQAWSGDWRHRLAERLRVRGFETMTAFAEANERESLNAMGEELSTEHDVGINRADLCAEQLLQVWRDEAQRAGSAAIERFSRRMLVGELHRDVPDGWRSDWSAPDADTERAASRLASVSARWVSNHSNEYRSAADRVMDALIADGRAGRIPSGWLPANADDPLLVEIFRLHWRE
jgi:hypothetical protein